MWSHYLVVRHTCGPVHQHITCLMEDTWSILKLAGDAPAPWAMPTARYDHELEKSISTGMMRYSGPSYCSRLPCTKATAARLCRTRSWSKLDGCSHCKVRHDAVKALRHHLSNTDSRHKPIGLPKTRSFPSSTKVLVKRHGKMMAIFGSIADIVLR